MSNSILNLPRNIFTSFQEISGLFLGNAGCGTIESMSFPKRLLGPGEKVILDIHPSATILLPNIFAAVLFFITGLAMLIFLPASWRPLSLWIVSIVLLAILAAVILIPFLRWKETTYTLTDRRFVARHGLVKKTGHDVPLSNIHTVRALEAAGSGSGSGTLALVTGDGREVQFPGILRAKEFAALATRQIEENQERFR